MDGILHPSSDDFYPKTMLSLDADKINSVTTDNGTKIDLIPIYNSDTKQEVGVDLSSIPMTISKDFDITKSKKLNLKCRDDRFKQFILKSDEASMQLAVDGSQIIHKDNCWDMEDMVDFKKYSRGNTKKINLYIPDLRKVSIFEVADVKQEDGTIKRETIGKPKKNYDLLTKGNIVYPVLGYRFLYYTDSNCGVSYTALCLAVKKVNRGFDFLLNPSKCSLNETNRYWTEVDIKEEMNFSVDKFTNPENQSIGVYFTDFDEFQLPKSRTPFGYGEMKPDPKKPNRIPISGNVDLDVEDESRTFLTSLQDYIAEKVVENWSRWFSSKPSKLTVATLKSKLMKPLIRESKNPRFKDLFKIKVMKCNDPTEKKYTEVYVMNADGTHVLGDYNDIQKNCDVIPVIRVTNIWFKSNLSSLGVTLQATRLVVFPAGTKSHPPVLMRNFPNAKRARDDMDLATELDMEPEAKKVNLDDTTYF